MPSDPLVLRTRTSPARPRQGVHGTHRGDVRSSEKGGVRTAGPPTAETNTETGAATLSPPGRGNPSPSWQEAGSAESPGVPAAAGTPSLN